MPIFRVGCLTGYTGPMAAPNSVQKTALTVTRWVGSPISIIVHSVLFLGSFFLAFSGFVSFDRMLLVLTTLVSLEAIYLSIFIQMTINYTSQTIEEVEKDIDEIQEDIDEMQEDVEEIQEDVEEISEDVEDISEDVDEIQKDVDELQEDVEDIEESDDADEKRKNEQKNAIAAIQSDLKRLLDDMERLKR